MRLAHLVVFAAVVIAAAEERRKGGILRVPLDTDLGTLDPALCYNIPGMLFVGVVYQSLVNYGSGSEIVPQLAKSWSISPNGLKYTFVLDERAHFSNGRAVLASDYLFSFERMLSPKMHCPGSFLYSGIAGVEEFREGKAPHIIGLEAPSPLRLDITLINPDLTLLFRLALPFAAPVCREELKEPFVDIGTHSAGAGPFKIERWLRGAKIEFSRNRFYGGSSPAWLDGIRAIMGVDDTVAQMMFERGELEIADLHSGVAGAEFPRIMRTPELRRNLEAVPSSSISYVALNTEMAPFTNKLVRQAMNYAVDKDRLVRMANGRIQQIPGVLPPVMPGFQPDLQGYNYSPETARRLLAQAGFPNGFTTSILFNNGVRENFRVVAAIQEDLRQVGIIMEAVPLTFTTYLEKAQRRKTTPMVLEGWSEDFPDPSNYLEALLDGETISERACQNVAFYNNPEVNDLLKKAAGGLNMSDRLTLYQTAEKPVIGDAPWIFLTARKQFCLHQPWLQNARPHEVWPFRFEKMWLSR